MLNRSVSLTGIAIILDRTILDRILSCNAFLRERLGIKQHFQIAWQFQEIMLTSHTYGSLSTEQRLVLEKRPTDYTTILKTAEKRNLFTVSLNIYLKSFYLSKYLVYITK